jgi:hypothetical protein
MGQRLQMAVALAQHDASMGGGGAKWTTDANANSGPPAEPEYSLNGP